MDGWMDGTLWEDEEEVKIVGSESDEVEMAMVGVVKF
jgi:hypothetical protein